MTDFSIPKKTFLLIPAGSYLAVISNLEKTIGTYGEQIRFSFRVFTPDVEYTDGEVELPAWCSTNYSEKSKLFRWTRAALAGDFDLHADFLASKLINRRVLVNVEKNTSSSGSEFNKIVDIMATPRDMSKQVTVTPQETRQPPEPPPPPDDLPW